jgi:hypothetical protein
LVEKSINAVFRSGVEKPKSGKRARQARSARIAAELSKDVMVPDADYYESV